jgi:acyl transferase domain-containing protein
MMAATITVSVLFLLVGIATVLLYLRVQALDATVQNAKSALISDVNRQLQTAANALKQTQQDMHKRNAELKGELSELTGALDVLRKEVEAHASVPSALVNRPLPVTEPPRPSYREVSDADLVRIWRQLKATGPVNQTRFLDAANLENFNLSGPRGHVPQAGGSDLGFLVGSSSGTVWFLPFMGATLHDLKQGSFDVAPGAYLPNALSDLEAPAIWLNGNILRPGRVA